MQATPAAQEAQATATSPRPLRADAARNRDRLLSVAGDVFAARGTDVSLEDIARQAGVGIGTLYRHFPTRDALVEAVYRNEVETICRRSAELAAEQDPERALSAWMAEFVGSVARKRGRADAIRAAVGADSALFADSRRQVMAAVDLLLDAAAQAGVVRKDVAAQDLLQAMSGICLVTGDPTTADQARRLVGLLMDGLRYGVGRPDVSG